MSITLKPLKPVMMMSLLFAILIGCSSKPNEPERVELVISAASSLTDALIELKPSFEKEHPNIVLTYHFGSSGKLANQIKQGAPSDIFLSASKNDMDLLEDQNMIQTESRIHFAENKLVLIKALDDQHSLTAFNQINSNTIEYIGVGDPDSVPAGKYAKEALQSVGVWDSLNGKLVFASNVRQVLAYVESGNVDVGIVYHTDALLSQKVKVVAEADSKWHSPIVYPAAILSQSADVKEAQAFIEFLSAPKAKEVLKKYGF